ncbi:hypothetical protein RRG08_020164 [Elysia crispata]|uniref:Uncharacterized protein n=1 Tax=Elysia crispata TaxID=231223 RepID=A0AAE0YXV9_9GAST|nr:hypothetical protein RRG08_020164 [Elysia crispata]
MVWPVVSHCSDRPSRRSTGNGMACCQSLFRPTFTWLYRVWYGLLSVLVQTDLPVALQGMVWPVVSPCADRPSRSSTGNGMACCQSLFRPTFP